MAVFALTMSHGRGWDSRGIREQQAWDEHASFMDGLVDDGFVILGGPLDDGQHALLMSRPGTSRRSRPDGGIPGRRWGCSGSARWNAGASG